MKIKWLGQSGYVLSDCKNKICIDPYLSDIVNIKHKKERLVCSPINPKMLNVDVVICTHNHLDHLDIGAIPMMDLDRIIFCAPSDCKQQLLDLDVKNISEFNTGDTYKIGDFKITATFADHTIPAIGLIVEYNGDTLYFSGDTCYHQELEKITCDYMFVCINGKLGNMNVAEAVKLTKIINPKVGIPNHYGMFIENTQDPHKYINNIHNGFVMEFNKEYSLKEIR